jgi:hypothetical protein
MEDAPERPNLPIREGPPITLYMVLDHLLRVNTPAFCLALVVYALCALAAIVWLHSWIAAKLPA